MWQDFPGGAVAKNLPASDRRFHPLVWKDPTCREAAKACAPQLPCLSSQARDTTTESCAPWRPCPQQEKPPFAATREGPHKATKINAAKNREN